MKYNLLTNILLVIKNVNSNYKTQIYSLYDVYPSFFFYFEELTNPTKINIVIFHVIYLYTT